MTMKNKKYETPEVKVVEMQTAPLLAGSEVTAGGESATLKGDFYEEN